MDVDQNAPEHTSISSSSEHPLSLVELSTLNKVMNRVVHSSNFWAIFYFIFYFIFQEGLKK